MASLWRLAYWRHRSFVGVRTASPANPNHRVVCLTRWLPGLGLRNYAFSAVGGRPGHAGLNGLLDTPRALTTPCRLDNRSLRATTYSSICTQKSNDHIQESNWPYVGPRPLLVDISGRNGTAAVFDLLPHEWQLRLMTVWSWPGSNQPSSHTNVVLALSLSHRNAEPSIELSSAFHFAVLPLVAPLASQVASPLMHDGAQQRAP